VGLYIIIPVVSSSLAAQTERLRSASPMPAPKRCTSPALEGGSDRHEARSLRSQLGDVTRADISLLADQARRDPSIRIMWIGASAAKPRMLREHLAR
jgi:hypothetical protein